MSKKENAKKIKKYIDEILNAKSSFIAKRPLKRNKLTNLLSESKNIDKYLISKLIKKISVLR